MPFTTPARSDDRRVAGSLLNESADRSPDMIGGSLADPPADNRHRKLIDLQISNLEQAEQERQRQEEIQRREQRNKFWSSIGQAVTFVVKVVIVLVLFYWFWKAANPIMQEFDVFDPVFEFLAPVFELLDQLLS